MADAVLVTRPKGQGAALCKMLRARGFEPLEFPLVEIVPCETLSEQQQTQLAQLGEYHILIFISSNAVQQGMYWINKTHRQLPQGLHWLAVGAGSAESLQAHGVAAEYPKENMSSEGLLALSRLQDVKARRILIIKGEGGRAFLRRQLSQRGAEVEELALYRRRPAGPGPQPLYELLRGQACRAMLFSSGEGLHNMVSLLSAAEFADIRHIPALLPAGRMADIARELGFGRVIEAANASDEAMLAALIGATEPIQGH